MIQFIDRSATFRALMGELFSGAQSYASLKRRLWRQFDDSVAEFLESIFRPAKPSRARPSPEDA